MTTQQQGPPSSTDIANKVIGAVDADGDGQLSLAEIEKALGADTTSGTDASSQANMGQAFAKLDANGDGKISADELASALDAKKAADSSSVAGPGGVHRHHHAHHASSADLAQQIFGQADANGDGALSADEISLALGQDAQGSATSATTSLTQAIAKLDTNGDGSLSTAELTAAIDAFRAAHKHGSADARSQTASTQAVTA
jgi:Ca2+-binding EF-hand superfamily protein